MATKTKKSESKPAAPDQQSEEPRVDEQGNEIVMDAHIPEGSEDLLGVEVEDPDQAAKENDLGDGLHKNSKTFGTVVSDYETDAAGLTPEAMAEQAEERGAKAGAAKE